MRTSSRCRAGDQTGRRACKSERRSGSRRRRYPVLWVASEHVHRDGRRSSAVGSGMQSTAATRRAVMVWPVGSGFNGKANNNGGVSLFVRTRTSPAFGSTVTPLGVVAAIRISKNDFPSHLGKHGSIRAFHWKAGVRSSTTRVWVGCLWRLSPKSAMRSMGLPCHMKVASPSQSRLVAPATFTRSTVAGRPGPKQTETVRFHRR